MVRNSAEIEQYVREKNFMRRIFREPPLPLPPTRASAAILVEMLRSDMSPENISCDGERSPSEVEERHHLLKKVASDLETFFELTV